MLEFPLDRYCNREHTAYIYITCGSFLINKVTQQLYVGTEGYMYDAKQEEITDIHSNANHP